MRFYTTRLGAPGASVAAAFQLVTFRRIVVAVLAMKRCRRPDLGRVKLSNMPPKADEARVPIARASVVPLLNKTFRPSGRAFFPERLTRVPEIAFPRARRQPFCGRNAVTPCQAEVRDVWGATKWDRDSVDRAYAIDAPRVM